MMERITLAEAHTRFKAQGVSDHKHIAFVCPICGTVQSMASLIAAGANPETVERFVAFSCEGRFSNVGPWPSDKDGSAKAERRRAIRGCNWTLGGLLRLHRLEIELPDSAEPRPTFVIATAEQAQELERLMTAKAEAETEQRKAL
jgi:hypothetical protein